MDSFWKHLGLSLSWILVGSIIVSCAVRLGDSGTYDDSVTVEATGADLSDLGVVADVSTEETARDHGDDLTPDTRTREDAAPGDAHSDSSGGGPTTADFSALLARVEALESRPRSYWCDGCSSSDWIITRTRSGGTYTVVFETGTFSKAPICVCATKFTSSSSIALCNVNSYNANQVSVSLWRITSTGTDASQSGSFTMACREP